MEVLRDSDELPWDGDLPATILVARKDFVDSNPKIVEKLINGHNQSIDFINSNEEETLDIVKNSIVEITNQDIETEIIRSSFKRVSFTSEINKNTLQEFANLSKDLGFIKGDTSLVDLYEK